MRGGGHVDVRAGAGLLVALALSSGIAAAQPITEFPIPTPSTGPTSLTAGPDGALWFTQRDFANGRTIGRMTLAGTVSEFPISGSNPLPNSIVSGPDGALWFADYGNGQIDRMTTSGAITTFLLPPDATYSEIDLAFGSDGNLWFTMSAIGSIGRMTPQGVFSEYPLPVTTTPRFPIAIVNGPDGALWFCDLEARAVGRMTTSGVLTDFPLASSRNPISIAVGPDQAIWVGVTGLQAALVRVEPSGAMHEFDLPAPFGDPIALTSGRDGAIWFVDFQANRVGRLTTAGELTSLDIPSANPSGAYPADIVTGPDGNVWLTENGDNQLARVAVQAVAVPSASDVALAILASALALSGILVMRRRV